MHQKRVRESFGPVSLRAVSYLRVSTRGSALRRRRKTKGP